ncbi:uncharacterized protein LAESUDRAFT_718697 [Laetiporus sulphureus 93-53]|uniref:Uncharacterized protein n=1 Tax=Laetiporus sulphureus 93-53 TaxID=1314785 RepID=A0A165AP06_9APHY|nr:uncharacterized protein LAESUDRAFT_718697 [Laetiporus sulphureus 93-53]KZS99379.1 hypothetical protein LAESUDRAFT_718697 [Laetiporus sulphureus 93-53]
MPVVIDISHRNSSSASGLGRKESLPGDLCNVPWRSVDNADIRLGESNSSPSPFLYSATRSQDLLLEKTTILQMRGEAEDTMRPAPVSHLYRSENEYNHPRNRPLRWEPAGLNHLLGGSDANVGQAITEGTLEHDQRNNTGVPMDIDTAPEITVVNHQTPCFTNDRPPDLASWNGFPISMYIPAVTSGHPPLPLTETQLRTSDGIESISWNPSNVSSWFEEADHGDNEGPPNNFANNVSSSMTRDMITPGEVIDRVIRSLVQRESPQHNKQSGGEPEVDSILREWSGPTSVWYS